MDVKFNNKTIKEREQAIIDFWKNNKIFEKTLEQTKNRQEFIFYDGPPFATGEPHYGHILTGVIKDVIPRYKTMRGFFVRRQWGWDCHGLPVENLIESELKLESKKDIQQYGIEKFNKAAESSVLRYEDTWKEFIPRTGRWIDMNNPYRSMDWKYTESVWWAFKRLYQKNLIYEGFKSMHLCPRCETTLSNFEVNQGYKEVTDISVYVKFKLTDEREPTFFLAWTTTPWTLIANAALAVKSEFNYVKIEIDGQHYILAKDRLSVISKENKIIEEIKGSQLIGKRYEPPFDYYKNSELKNSENAWKVYQADFVTTDDGTGIVHIAPAFGSDDLWLAEKEKLPIIHHVSTDGKIKGEISDFAGLLVKPKNDPQSTDILILKNLATRNLLFGKEKIIHSYPHCWRCDTPLLNYASSSWFVSVTDIKKKLIRENKKINWIPERIREGRFGVWLEGIKDWAISRSRYWGAVIPVWKCQACREIRVIGSISDIKNNSKPRNNYFVMRHGQAENNIRKIISADPKNPHHLTQLGKEQVNEAGQKLKNKRIDLIIASPFLRTQETAQMVANIIGYDRSAILTDNRLSEVRANSFEGKTVGEYHSSFSSDLDYFSTKRLSDENYQDIKSRMAEFIYDIDQRYEKKNILIITHDSPGWLLFAAVAGASPFQSVKMRGTDSDFIKNGEIKDLQFTPLPHNKYYELDLHKPFIDEIFLNCKCGQEMKRINEVFDCWFESGSMPYARFHYPFENKDKFSPAHSLFKKQKGFPADFVAEGVDQTRGWFYTLLVLSTALFGESPYKNVIVNGLILSEDGKKMSKRFKNYQDPSVIMDKYGADALRLYVLSLPVIRGEDANFLEKNLDETNKKNILRLRNVLSFYLLYKENNNIHIEGRVTSDNILDRWILARLKELGNNVTKFLDAYILDKAVNEFGGFIDDLSTWYIRRSRGRFKDDSKESQSDKNEAIATTKFVLEELSKYFAPFAPFISEEIFRLVNDDKSKESVHLEGWPDNRSLSKSDVELLESMNFLRRIISLALEARSRAGIKTRQPLAEIKIKDLKFKTKWQYLELIKDEINVKKIVFDPLIAEETELSTEITDELRKEGELRDFIRILQDFRKEKNYDISEMINLEISASISEDLKNFIIENTDQIKKTAKIGNIYFDREGVKEINLGDNKFFINFSKAEM